MIYKIYAQGNIYFDMISNKILGQGKLKDLAWGNFGNNFTIPISKRAYELLKEYGVKKEEEITISESKKELVIISIPEITEADLDMEKCQVEYIPGTDIIINYKEIVFKESNLDVFRIKAKIFVSERVKKTIEEKKLTGFLFYEL